MLGELNEMQINNVLVSQVVGRLACVEKNKPYLIPVTYAFDGKHIYGQLREGKKAIIMRKNPNICLQVDIILDMANWQSVCVFGKYEELKGKEAQKARDLLLNRVMPMMTSSTVHYNPDESTAPLDDSNRLKPVLYRINIEKKTGRFEKG